MNKFKKILVFIIVFIIICLVVFLSRSFNKEKDKSFYAFFLANNQVYFGNLVDQNKKEFTLSNVYYLQDVLNDPNKKENSQFNLVKLGDELHGPTNEMFINRDAVLFYEKLRDDSKLVASIKDR